MEQMRSTKWMETMPSKPIASVQLKEWMSQWVRSFFALLTSNCISLFEPYYVYCCKICHCKAFGALIIWMSKQRHSDLDGVPIFPPGRYYPAAHSSKEIGIFGLKSYMDYFVFKEFPDAQWLHQYFGGTSSVPGNWFLCSWREMSARYKKVYFKKAYLRYIFQIYAYHECNEKWSKGCN